MLSVNIMKHLWHFKLEVDFVVKAGEILVLWGHSGAGKTTVLECLAGLKKPDDGIISLGGQVLFSHEKSTHLPARKRNIGYVFQNYALFPHLNVEDNVNFGLKYQAYNKVDQQQTQELLSSFGISHLSKRYTFQLSGGEKQRVALARALAAQPKLLLLDEPFSALDREIKLDLINELKTLHFHWNIPIVLVTHDEEDAYSLGDQIIYMDHGQISKRQILSEEKDRTSSLK